MAATRNEGFFERTLANVTGAWRDIASGAARSIGRNGPLGGQHDAETLERLMLECLEARGGEASARMRAAELGEIYLRANDGERQAFLKTLARAFAVDQTAVERAIRRYQEAQDAEAKIPAEGTLRTALAAPRVRLLAQFNALPEGVKFLVDLRADLLRLAAGDPYLRDLELDLRGLLASWFDIGFLNLRRITWDSPAALLEKLIAYEAVHEIRSWDDLHNRLDKDRRLFALFHPRMPGEPLAFVEVALVKGMAKSVQGLLDQTAPVAVAKDFDSAVFYSISNTQKGLRGISFGDYLIKRVVQELTQDLPRIKRFATLSPIPGFRLWLEGFSDARIEAALKGLGLPLETAGGLKETLARAGWHADRELAQRLHKPLLRLCARYFLETRETKEPLDPVARFHLRNGARLDRLFWLGDVSAKGLRQSAGIMVSYRYILDDIEKNHEAYLRGTRLAIGSEIKSLAKGLA